MIIGVPRESAAGERRVAATPRSVEALITLGHRVVVEAGAGEPAGFDDAAYASAGATTAAAAQAWDADLVLHVDAPVPDERARLRAGTLLVALLAPATNPELLDALAAADVTALAMDAVPRISRAQSLDVLSSMAHLAGYRAVIEAAHSYGGLFTGQVTAAGRVPPARVFVVGAGVAGLAAIGTAVSLGAEVRAFDVRAEVAEQVASLGAEFVGADAVAQGRADGYAAELAGDQEAAARLVYDTEARAADIVIATAQIPGRPAPLLISADTVAAMRPGSVVVDLAAASGGNVAGTVAGQQVRTPGGITILGWTDLPSRMPALASQLYAANLVELVRLLTPQRDGNLQLDADDPVQRAMTVTRDGAVTWPPPPLPVAAGPAPAPAPSPEATPVPAVPTTTGSRPLLSRRMVGAALAAVIFGLVATVSPASFLADFTVLALAVVVGFYVISNVTHALHTPLMSVTNAISGIICVGAVLQVGRDDPVVTAIALAGVLIASINIVGGFVVTQRMLGMFRRDQPATGRDSPAGGTTRR